MAGRKGNKTHANNTSFTSEVMLGKKNAEKWTEEGAEKFFIDAIEISKEPDIYTLNFIARKMDVYDHVFSYLIEKFPIFSTHKSQINENLKNNLTLAGLAGKTNPTMSIFILKAVHGLIERQIIDANVNNNITSLPIIEFFNNAGKDKDTD